jgi:hypothetical protein
MKNSFKFLLLSCLLMSLSSFATPHKNGRNYLRHTKKPKPAEYCVRCTGYPNGKFDCVRIPCPIK